MSEREMRAEYGSDIIVDLLKAYGIKYAAFNPGATFRGIHDSIVNYGGNREPEIIECCHEEISVAIAHGYAKAAGQPMVAITHNIVGLQHASMAIFNAWCDRVPVIVLGGTGPMDTTRRRPWIDWTHTALVQGNLVRDFVKLDDQPYSVAAVPESFVRAYRLAVTEPCGPVYVCFDADIQEGKLTEPVAMPDLNRFAPAPPVAANPTALNQAAELLVKAQRPVIVSGTVGRNPAAVGHLIALAELVVAPVVDRGYRFNFPSTHPLDLTGADAETLREADVVLALDAVDLFGALGTVNKATRQVASHLRPEAKIIHISMSDLGVRSWAADYHKLQEVDVPIIADTAIAISQLLDACQANGCKRNEDRFQSIKARHDELRARWKARAMAEANDVPISPASMVAAVGEVIKGEDWVLANANIGGWPRRLWDWTRPGQYVGGSGGSGLGYGPGAALGVALAYRDTDKLCVSLQNDGDFLFTPSALWTAARHKLPLLTIMNNNRTYYNSEEHQEEVSRVRGRALANAGMGTKIEGPAVDFAALARSFGVYAEGPVERPKDVAPAVRRAMEAVKEQRAPALVDVVTRPGAKK